MTAYTNDIIGDMDQIREMCSLVRAARKEVGVPQVQPLMDLTFYKDEEFDWLLFSQYSKIIADDCNIRHVQHELIFDGDYEKFNIKSEATLNFREAGKLFGKKTQDIGKAVKSGDYKKVNGGFDVAGEFLHEGLINLSVSVDNEENLKRDYHVTRVGDKSFFVLDTLIYSGLYMDRIAQELIKAINAKRREENLAVGDFIFLSMELSGEYAQAYLRSCEEINSATKTRSIELRKLKTNESGFNIQQVSRIF